MSKKTNKAVAKVCDLKGSKMVFIPKKLNIDLEKGEYMTLEVIDKDTIKLKRV